MANPMTNCSLRSKSVTKGMALEPELGWLAQLCDEMMKRASALSPPCRAFAEMRLGYWFKDHDERIAAFRAKSKPANAALAALG